MTDLLARARIGIALAIVRDQPEFFRQDFEGWLLENWSIYERFEREALVVAARRKHYGANTIIEYLRHQTLLADTASEWKLDDRWTSSIARLFAMMNSAHDKLFEFRERRKDGVVLAPGRAAA